MHTNHYSRSFPIAVASLVLLLLSLLAFSHSRADRQPIDSTAQFASAAGASSIALLPTPVRLEGNKILAHMKLPLPQVLIRDRDIIKVTYDLYGLCISAGAAASIDVRQNDTTLRQIPLATAGKNCHQGTQSIDIPVSFLSMESADTAPVELHISVWYPTNFSVEIQQVVAYNAGSAVLGVSIPEMPAQIKKTFDHITPLRAQPYAKENIAE